MGQQCSQLCNADWADAADQNRARALQHLVRVVLCNPRLVPENVKLAQAGAPVAPLAGRRPAGERPTKSTRQ